MKDTPFVCELKFALSRRLRSLQNLNLNGFHYQTGTLSHWATSACVELKWFSRPAYHKWGALCTCLYCCQINKGLLSLSLAGFLRTPIDTYRENILLLEQRNYTGDEIAYWIFPIRHKCNSNNSGGVEDYFNKEKFTLAQ